MVLSWVPFGRSCGYEPGIAHQIFVLTHQVDGAVARTRHMVWLNPNVNSLIARFWLLAEPV